MKFSRRTFLHLAAGGVSLPVLPPLALAQSYPTRPARIVVPFPPGQATDTVGRLVGQSLTERLGQGFVIENRTGAGGTIGTEAVAHSTPDGYTLLLNGLSGAFNATLYKKPDFDFLRDLAPVASIGQLSTAPLLIGETFSLGGTQFLRGYDFAQRVGDEGAAGLAELRYDWPRALGAVRNLQLYAYADGGTVSNLAAGRRNGTLASSGAGLRTDITRDLDLDFEVAVPLTEDRYDTGDNTPRINVRVSQSF